MLLVSWQIDYVVCYIMVSQVFRHFVILFAYGQVYGWGSNEHGQLGLQDVNHVTTPALLEVHTHVDLYTHLGTFTYM